jgi:hypothetical protein
MIGRKSMTLKVGLAVAILACAAPVAALAETYFGFSIGVGNAPPPPRAIVVSQPDLILMPGTSVYEVENSPYETFYYGRAYYTFNDGYWYRARSSRGPFFVVDVRSMPTEVLEVPSYRWRHRAYGAQYGGYRQDWQQWQNRSYGQTRGRSQDWRDRQYWRDSRSQEGRDRDWRDRRDRGDWPDRQNDRDGRDRQDARDRNRDPRNRNPGDRNPQGDGDQKDDRDR